MDTNKARHSDAVWVARRLQEAGHQALLAGGCVRDLLLGREPDDYDVATSATPEQIQALFRKVLMIGAQFGVAMVLHRGRVIETATFRSEGDYSDGRRPDRVDYCDARSDALRRDFTINGMFMDPVTGEVLDYVGGREDLDARIVRAIGQPRERFGEDFLRMLRAVRFAARLDFSLDAATAEAIAAHAAGLERISGERIREELEKIFNIKNVDSASPQAAPQASGETPSQASPESTHVPTEASPGASPGASPEAIHEASRVRALEMIDELGLRPHVFGAALAGDDAWGEAFDRCRKLDASARADAVFACLYAGCAAGAIKAVCRRWGASNALRQTMTAAAARLELWRTAGEPAAMALCDFKRLMASEDWPRLLAIWQAEELRLTGEDRRWRAIVRRAESIAPEQVAPAPLVTGEDLIALGLPESPRLGGILRRLRDMQLNETLAARDDALAAAHKMLDEGRDA